MRDKGSVNIGLARQAHNNSMFNYQDNCAYRARDGYLRVFETIKSYGSSYDSGDIVEVRVCICEQWVEFLKNGES